jgi:hypothetical protein
MKLLWNIAKVLIVLALAIPVSLLVLTTALGVLGALVGLAAIAIRLAVVGAIAWVAWRVIKAVVRGPDAPVAPRVISSPRVDPYYEAAMREVDRDVGVIK